MNPDVYTDAAAEPQKGSEMNQITSELARVGADVDEVGSVDGICCAAADGGAARVYDDHAEVVGQGARILAALRVLPDGAGWAAVWDALNAMPGKPRTRYQVVGDEVRITYPDGEERAYRTVGIESGYVYDVTRAPGTQGRQVLDPRGPAGTTLTGPRDGQALSDLLRECLRAARGWHARHDYAEPADVRL